MVNSSVSDKGMDRPEHSPKGSNNWTNWVKHVALSRPEHWTDHVKWLSIVSEYQANPVRCLSPVNNNLPDGFNQAW